MKKFRLILIILSVLVLLACIGMTVFLLFSNFRNVRLFKQAKAEFLQGDKASLDLAEIRLLQLVRTDSDNEAAFIMLGEIAEKRKIYSEQLYYCHMAYRLNPLSRENKNKYIESLCFTRRFGQLETLLNQESSLSDSHKQLLLYAAGQNGNIRKHKHQLDRRGNDNRIGELAFLLFKHTHLSNQEKLHSLDRFLPDASPFLKQEIYAAKTDLYLAVQNVDKAEESLLEAYKLNQYAFAPALGRFYARYRNFGKALKVLEDHLSIYHDLGAAIQIAEIYCLLGKTDKIAKLRTAYQADSGSRAMICNYYLDALSAFAKKDMVSLKELTIPLRNNLNTPLSAFIFFCADIQSDDPAAIKTSYTSLSVHKDYLNLQAQADEILLEYLKKSFAGKKGSYEKLLNLAALLYNNRKDVFTAKLILLAQKRDHSINPVLLNDALKHFSGDQGIVKIAIEYYLQHELSQAEELIAFYKRNFSEKSGDMFRYEIFLNMRKKDYDRVSELFRKNFKPEILPDYWTFASSLMRENDLLYLSRDKKYEPFCTSLLLMKKGEKKLACDLLEKTDGETDLSLLFFAAKTLAENGRNEAALKKYALFPRESSYRIAVLLNMSEIYAETGNLDQALLLAGRAYALDPLSQETQLCYGDKLFKKGKLSIIPDVIKVSSSTLFKRRMEPMWIAGMRQKIKECDIHTRKEKIRELCRQLQVIAPDDHIAREYLEKLNKMPQ